MLIPGKCHCGNIAIELEWPDDARIPARKCGCSFCVKHGGVWTSNPRAKVKVAIADAKLVSRYAFGTRTADFLACARCGVVPVVTSEIDGRTYAVVSVNALEGVAEARLDRAPADFEGEETGARLDRRKRNWIGDVSVSVRSTKTPARRT